MRAYVRRDKVLVGDRLAVVVAGREEVTQRIHTVGTETVILEGGVMVPLPSGRWVDVERD